MTVIETFMLTKIIYIVNIILTFSQISYMDLSMEKIKRVNYNLKLCQRRFRSYIVQCAHMVSLCIKLKCFGNLTN